MTWCSVKGCSNNSSCGKSLFVVPTDPQLRARWLEYLRKSGKKNIKETAQYRLCEDHFRYQDITVTHLFKRTRKGALPSEELMFPHKTPPETPEEPSGNANSTETEKSDPTTSKTDEDPPEELLTSDDDDLMIDESDEDEMIDEEEEEEMIESTHEISGDSDKIQEEDKSGVGDSTAIVDENSPTKRQENISLSSEDAEESLKPQKTSKFPQIMGQTTIRAISVKKNLVMRPVETKPSKPVESFEMIVSDEEGEDDLEVVQEKEKPALIVAAVPKRKISEPTTSFELSKLPSGSYTISGSNKQQRSTDSPTAGFPKAIIYPKNSEEKKEEFAVPEQKTKEPLLIDDSRPKQQPQATKVAVKRRPGEIRYLVPQDMLASSSDKIKKIVASSSSSDSSDACNYDGDLFVMEEDKKMEPTTSGITKRPRKESIVPKVDQDEEPDFEIPPRPQINIDLIDNLAKCRVLVQSILKKIDVPLIDFNEASDDYISMYQIYKE